MEYHLWQSLFFFVGTPHDFWTPCGPAANFRTENSCWESGGSPRQGSTMDRCGIFMESIPMNRDEPYSCAEFWMILYMVTWLNEAIWCYMMLYDVISGYIMMFYDVIWYYTMLHDVIWCFVLFERTLILWNCWWKLIISWSMCENPTEVIWLAKYGLLKWSRW